MITIANPIYDVVFKKLMEDLVAARSLLSALLGEEVEILELLPQERTLAMPGTTDIRVMRFDYRATLRYKDKVKKEKQRYYLKHKTRLQEKANTYKETSRLELSDYYVIEQLIKRTSLNHRDILEHPDLIKAKRFQLKIHRQLNN